MRPERFAAGEYYHIYNRGVEKRPIFYDDQDRSRFLSLLLLFQGDFSFQQITRFKPCVQHRMLDIHSLPREIERKIMRTRVVELNGFIFMKNHFHLMAREQKDGGVSKFMQRLGNAYTKYFNIKYRRRGHLFEGKFNASHVDKNEYLLYLSAYIHLNVREVPRWRGHEETYQWSSFKDYMAENRFGKLLNSSIVLRQFEKKQEYKNFVKESDIKNFEQIFDVQHRMLDRGTR